MVTAITGAVALVAVLLAVLALRAAGRARAAAEAARAATRAAEARITELAAEPPRRTEPAPDHEPEPSYVITGIGADEEPRAVAAQHVDGRLFADIVARESVIRAAGLAHGLRRALGAETRNRIRFEVRREVKRARKQRRTDLKAALRDLQARQRADLADEGDAA